jgi:4-alpha-glucanotransferase
MQIVFRLNYHTTPGQTLWLKYSTAGEVHETPLAWLNDKQWQGQIDVCGSGRLRLSYHYQLRQSSNGVVLDEWGTPRVCELDLDTHQAVILLADWRSASTPDYAYQTKAIPAPLRELSEPPTAANHSFQLQMAGVPPGQVPCLLGSIRELGEWNWHAAVPLLEVSPDVWLVNLSLPVTPDIDYKYGLFDLEQNRMVSLELGENRQISWRSYAANQRVQVQDECYRREPASLYRAAGVAIPVFSLRSDHSLGCGEFADLKPLADWARSVGLKLIQILPINDTTSAHDWTDSYPYSAISVFALHPIYLRLSDITYLMPHEFIADLQTARDLLNPLEQVDHVAVMAVKTKLTRQVFAVHQTKIIESLIYQDFLTANAEWLIPYAAFCVMRDKFGTADFSQWQEWACFNPQQVAELLQPFHTDWPDMAYHIWLQCELDTQLSDAVSHLHDKGLVLKGDLPIGIDRQSADAWAAPHLFKMEAQAGAPPDAFAVKGQNWGFPTYHWEVMQQDDYAWWRGRFAQLSRYFDAYRIDHILGFFRIWQVPYEQVEGIMGHFDPALPISIDEFHKRGIEFSHSRFCRPYLQAETLERYFGSMTEYVIHHFLHEGEDGIYALQERVLTQRRIFDYFNQHPDEHGIRQGLLNCVSEVLFFEVPGSHGNQFHPRMSLQATCSFQALDKETQKRVEDLHNDYFYQRQENFWQGEGYAKLPAMRRASKMLLCGEDLGMVPHCVPGVMRELGILSLEIQRMPKTHVIEFYDPKNAPYLSVVSPTTHDMSTLRGWWREDAEVTARFTQQMFGISSPEPELSGEMAERIITQHLQSPAMWAIFPLQDLLAMDETLRHPDPTAERINVPAIMPYYWRYRMHLRLDDLAAAQNLNCRLSRLVRLANR